MTVLHPNELKNDARRSLDLAPESGRLVLIFSGVAAAASLLVALLNFLLSTGIAGTGGLSGMGLRGILSTVQTMLELVLSLALPFWSMGYIWSVMNLSRRQDAGVSSLFEGFRRVGPVLRLLLVRVAVYLLLGFVSIQVGSSILTLTPLGADFLELTATMDPNLLMNPDEATALLMVDAMIPIFIGCGVLFAIGAVIVAYYTRFAQYFLLDDPRGSAIRAMLCSVRAMRGNVKNLLRLDLSWWWYYLLELLTTAVCFGDLWLPLLGFRLPFSEDAAYFIFYILGLGLQVLLHLRLRNTLECTYALAYDGLKPTQMRGDVYRGDT